jgi:hypothetical protein
VGTLQKRPRFGDTPLGGKDFAAPPGGFDAATERVQVDFRFGHTMCGFLCATGEILQQRLTKHQPAKNRRRPVTASVCLTTNVCMAFPFCLASLSLFAERKRKGSTSFLKKRSKNLLIIGVCTGRTLVV